MNKRRDIRRLAMQVLYQIDLAGDAERQDLLERMDDEYDPMPLREEAVDLAQTAWTDHDDADRLVTELAPDWPTHRQPPVDRAILRLAYHEMVSGRAPVKVAINEAVELSKIYAGENSPSFINGVLDKLAKRVPGEEAETTDEEAPPSPEVWLDDALTPQSETNTE